MRPRFVGLGDWGGQDVSVVRAGVTQAEKEPARGLANAVWGNATTRRRLGEDLQVKKVWVNQGGGASDPVPVIEEPTRNPVEGCESKT